MEWIQQPILKLRIWIGFFSTLCKILTCNVIFQSFCVFDLTIFSISNSTSSSVSSWYFDPPNFLFWSLSNVFPAKAFFNASRSKSYSVLGSECFLQIKRNESVSTFSESKIKNQIDWKFEIQLRTSKYRISVNSYSFLDLEIVANSNSCRNICKFTYIRHFLLLTLFKEGNYSRAETIPGNTEVEIEL